MSSSPIAKIHPASKFQPIWIVPLAAIAVSLWLGIRALHDRGPEITIEFADVSDLEAGKTILQYKGVTVGVVKTVALRPDLTRGVVRLSMKKEGGELARSGSLFWIVRPEIGAGGVQGLETLMSGVRLMVRPGKGPPAQWFRGLDKPPPPEVPDRGRTFILRTDQLGSLNSGSPVMYRQLKVGQVEASRLAPDATGVLVRIHLDEPYGDLVRANTRFWNAGGFNIKISLLGAEIKDSSLESLISGGIGFATPDGPNLAPAAENGAQFDLAPAAEKEWLKWAPKIPVKTDESVPTSPPKSSILPEVLEK
jgi:paraquat-inducible protein B